MDNTDLITKARELCDAAKSVKERGNALDSAAMSWAITNNCVPQLCDALEAAEKENEGLKNILRFNMVQIHGERMTVLDALSSLTARAEKAEAELNIVYELADNMANGTHEAVQAYEDWLHAGETVYEEGE